MKKKLFFLLFLLIAALGWGQISNGDFESWTNGLPDDWTTIDSGITVTQETTTIHNGNSSASIEVTTTSQNRTDFRQTVSLINGHNYTVSVWIKHTEGKVKARLYADDGYRGYSDNSNTSSWQQITYSFTASDTSSEFGLRFYDQTGFDGSEIVYVDDYTLTDNSLSDPTITTSTTSLTNFTYVEGNGPSGEQSFTVEGSNLTGDITVTPPANWEIATALGGPYQTSAITLAQSGGTVGTTTIYTRMVAGLSHGTYSGNIVCSTDDGSGGTLTENVAVDGSVTYSNASDIIANTGFSYTVNIPYVDYQADPITNTTHSVGVFKFDIRDGGGSADSDALGTELTAITFSVGSAHGGYIRSAALFDGNTHLADGTVNSGTGEISFSGLSGADFTAPDDGTKSLTLRVSFTTNVTDNEQLQFTVISATADNNGSVFAEADAGGAQSAVTGDKNRIEVVADRLIFGQQPTTTIVNEVMSPAVTVKGVDVYQNLDLDFAGDVSITSLGTMTGDPITVTAVNGVATFDNIVHTEAETDLFLEASCSGFTAVDSDTFDIVESLFNTGDYRTIASGTWDPDDTSPVWQRYDGSNWNNSDPPAYNTSNAIYIRHTITTGGSFGNSVKIHIMNGGVLKINHPSTAASTKIYDGGSLRIYRNYQNDGTFEVEDNGELVIQYKFNNPFTSIWKGTENFHPNSTVIFKDYDCANDFLLDNDTSVTLNTYNGYTAAFGHIILDFTDKLGNSDDWVMLESGVNYNMAHGNLIFRTNDNENATMRISRSGTVTSGIGGNLIVEDGYTNQADIILKTSGSMNFTVKGNVDLNAATFKVMAGSSGTSVLNIDGDLKITPSAVLNFNSTVADDPVSIINLKGDLTVASSGLLYNTNSSNLGNLNFVGMGDGLTPETTQTIDIASTSSNENKYINFNVKNGAYVQCVNQNFELGKNSKLTVEEGGTYDFGFNGTTALLVTKSGTQTGTGFDLQNGGYLKITSPDGIMSDCSAGNVQTVASNTHFSSLATFHYVGKENQVTGDAIGSSSNGRAVIVELENNSLTLTPSQSFGITNYSNAFINNGNGGVLDIRKGKFIETNTVYITGSTGGLKMEDGTYYKIVKNSADNSDVIPRLQGLNNSYDLNGNSTIELAGDGSQVLRGGRDYRNLTFSNAGTKTVSSAVPHITGELTIQDNAVLDVENKTMGGANTDFYMFDNAVYITAGTGTKPDAEGDYLLEETTKIIFNNNETTNEVIRLGQGTPIEYANIEVDGSSVANTSLVTGIRMQPGTVFKVNDAAVFKLFNTAGFNGGTQTAIDSTNSPTITLEPGSAVEYAGDNQTLTDFSPGYRNLKISGSGIKTVFDNGNAGTYSVVTIKEDLDVAASTLQIDDFRSVIVDGDITNNGQITVQNQGSLVQTAVNPDISAGNYTLNKIASGLSHYYDYVFWSSPLNDNNFAFQDLVPNAWAYYRFDPSLQDPSQNPDPGWVPVSPTDAFASGTGYAVSAPTGFGGGSMNASFSTTTGMFNTGDIQVNIVANGTGAQDDDDWNLIGNPYPSAIDFSALVNDNTIIEGAYYLWTNCAGLDAQGHHQEAGYAVYASGTGGVQACSTGITPSGYIATGQGFFVEANSSGTLTFKNSHRVAGNNDNFAGRPAPGHKLWLDLTVLNAAGFSQALIGFVQGATTGKDRLYDARLIGGGSVALYSLTGNDRLSIQGLPPLDSTLISRIPLGVYARQNASLNIHLNRTEGDWNRWHVYLYDRSGDIYHEITQSDYSFNVQSGFTDDRFELVLVPYQMEVENVSGDSVFVASNDGIFTVKAKNLQSIEVYDMNGRFIMRRDARSQGEEETVDLTRSARGVYLLVVHFKDGSVLKRKVIR